MYGDDAGAVLWPCAPMRSGTHVNPPQKIPSRLPPPRSTANVILFACHGVRPFPPWATTKQDADSSPWVLTKLQTPDRPRRPYTPPTGTRPAGELHNPGLRHRAVLDVVRHLLSQPSHSPRIQRSAVGRRCLCTACGAPVRLTHPSTHLSFDPSTPRPSRFSSDCSKSLRAGSHSPASIPCPRACLLRRLLTRDSASTARRRLEAALPLLHAHRSA